MVHPYTRTILDTVLRGSIRSGIIGIADKLDYNEVFAEIKDLAKLHKSELVVHEYSTVPELRYFLRNNHNRMVIIDNCGKNSPHIFDSLVNHELLKCIADDGGHFVHRTAHEKVEFYFSGRIIILTTKTDAASPAIRNRYLTVNTGDLL